MRFRGCSSISIVREFQLVYEKVDTCMTYEMLACSNAGSLVAVRSTYEIRYSEHAAWSFFFAQSSHYAIKLNDSISLICRRKHTMYQSDLQLLKWWTPRVRMTDEAPRHPRLFPRCVISVGASTALGRVRGWDMQLHYRGH